MISFISFILILSFYTVSAFIIQKQKRKLAIIELSIGFSRAAGALQDMQDSILHLSYALGLTAELIGMPVGSKKEGGIPICDPIREPQRIWKLIDTSEREPIFKMPSMMVLFCDNYPDYNKLLADGKTMEDCFEAAQVYLNEVIRVACERHSQRLDAIFYLRENHRLFKLNAELHREGNNKTYRPTQLVII